MGYPLENIPAERLHICEACGAIMNREDAYCSVCNTPSRIYKQMITESENTRFIRAILRRPATFTLIILLANIGIFLLMSFSGGSTNPEVLRAYGAKYNSLIEVGEWWRWITPMFLHIGTLHLLTNMYGLWMLGQYVERLYGAARFVVFWIMTGIAGVVASYITSRPDIRDGVTGPIGYFLFRGTDGPSAGASGALFGLIGVLLVFGIKFRHELPEGFKQAFGYGMLPTILINLFIGYTIPFIDNSAHLGGLIAGIVIALFVNYKRVGDEKKMPAIMWHAAQIVGLTLVLFSFLHVVRNYNGEGIDFSKPNFALLPMNEGSGLITNINAINQGEQAFLEAFNNNDKSKIDAAIESLNKAPSIDPEGNNLRMELRDMLVKVNKLEAEDKRQAKERIQLFKEFQNWNERLAVWASKQGFIKTEA
jgi:rhomboid protease GluP